MKKIMLALVVTLVTCVSQASSVKWKFTGSAQTEGYDVYALVTWPKEILSVDDFGSSKGTVTKNGRVYATEEGTLDGFSAKSGDSVNYYLALVGADAEGNQMYYQVAMTGTAYTPGSTDVPTLGTFDGKSIGAVGSEGWTKISGATPPGPGGDVPEPTSGLLLALGGAALALRRKQK